MDKRMCELCGVEVIIMGKKKPKVILCDYCLSEVCK